MLPCVSAAETLAATNNRGLITRWDRLRASKDIQLFGRLHSDLFNVPLFIMPGTSLQIRLTQALHSFYMISTDADSKITFKFLDAQL